MKNTSTASTNNSVMFLQINNKLMKRIIIISCAVAFICSLISAYFTTQSSLSKTSEKVASDFTDIMQAYRHSFSLFEVILQQEIKHSNSINEIESFLKMQDKRFLEIEGEDYDGVYMFYKDRYLYSWDTPAEAYEGTGYDARKRPWYVGAVKSGGEIFFSTPYPSYANDYMLATLSRLQDDGETVIAYDIKLGEIGKFVDELDIFNGALALICDSDGNIIGSTNHQYQGGNYTYSDETLIRNIQAAKSELSNADDAKKKVNAEKKLASAQALSKFGAVSFPFLKRLLMYERTLGYSVTTSSFGFAYSNGKYVCLVTAPIIDLLPHIAILWAALSFILIIFSCLIMRMLLRKRQVLTDSLTGLNNRRAFANYCSNHVRYHADENLGLLILDLNRFKAINDMYGHMIGDKALLETSTLLRNVCASSKNNCFLCRYGGDEFLLALTKCKMEDLVHIRTEITKAFEKNNHSGQRDYVLNASIGIACKICNDKKSMEALIIQADSAMYEEKKRNSCSIRN